jgi:pimeloyl-ACP methyl ester carboxylesterase
MNSRRIAAAWAAVFAAASLASSPAATRQTPVPTSEMRVPVGDTSLYARDVGRGRPLIVLHGGPDFDQAYLQPELDELADTYRLVYYDQRGRGKSGENVRPEDVTLASDLDDRLYRDTWSLPGYGLLPKLRGLRIPTLVIVGEQDFIPPAIATEIAHSIREATLVRIPNCGHFAYLECGSAVRSAMNDLFARTRP